MDLTKEEVIARTMAVIIAIALIVMSAMSCSAAYIQVPNIGAIMERARASAAAGAWEFSHKVPANIPSDHVVVPDEKPVIEETPAEETASEEHSQMEVFNNVADQIKNDIPTYDYGTSSLTRALSSKKGNCLAYSLYMKIACDSVGIPCSIVFATKDPNSLSSGMHIWNRVTIDGTKYWCDMSTYVLGHGAQYKLSESVLASHRGYSNYYILNVSKGAYKELTALKKNFTYNDKKTVCSAASQTAKSAKSEYSKCEAVISPKFN